MRDQHKTKKQLVEELSVLRLKIADLEGAYGSEKRPRISFQSHEGTCESVLSIVRLMCDNVPDLIWAKDLDKKYLFANKAICEHLLGAKDTEEPVGKTDMFFAERERKAHPDDPAWHTFGETCRDSDQVVMRSGKPERFNETGNVKGKFLYLDVYKAPFLDEQGRVIGTVGCAREATREKEMDAERRQAAKAIVQAEKKYMDIFNNAIEGIFQTTPDGKIITANASAARMLGYRDVNELMTSVKNVGLQLYANYKDGADITKKIMALGHIKGFETEIFRNDGSRIWVRANVRVVRNAVGELIRYEGTVQDITAYKNLQEERLKAHKLESIGILAGGIAHDFNNLLAPILASISMTRESPDLDRDSQINLAWRKRPACRPRN